MHLFRGYVAEIERLRIRERTARGKKTRVEKGRLINGSTPLYGYSQSKETSARAVCQSEARVIRRILGLAFAGFGATRIAQKLNGEGVESPASGKRRYKDERNSQWSKSAILRILREPAYAGVSVAFRWKSEKKKGKRKRIVTERAREEWVLLDDSLTPAIVTMDEFDRMQALLSSRTCGDAARNENHFSLLRGLIYCGKCGRRREPDASTNNYRCTSRGSALGKCGSPSTPMKAIEEYAWAELVKRAANPDWINALLSNYPEEDGDAITQQARRAELETALTKLTSQQKRLLTHLADAEGELAAMVAGQVKQLETEKRSIAAELATLTRKDGSRKEARRSLSSLVLAFQSRLLDTAFPFPDERKREYLQKFSARITTDGKEDWGISFGEALRR